MKRLAMMTLGIITLLCALGIWVMGIGVAVSLAAVFLKLLGLDFVQGVSYWAPVQFATAWLVCFIGTLVGMVAAQGGE